MSISVENNQRLVDEYAARASFVHSFPAVMYIESTRGCPYSCIMCNVPEQFGRKSQDFDPLLLEKLKPYFQYLEILAIHGSGEPLLSKNMDFFIQAARDNHCFLHMNTTGFYLTPGLADRLLAAPLSIRFSIHAGTPATYRKIMGNDLDRVMRNIEYLMTRNAQSGSNENEFWFSYLVMNENINEIDEFLHLAHRVGISKVRFMALEPNGMIVKGTTREDPNFTFTYSEQFNRLVGDSFLARLPDIRGLAQQLGISLEAGSMESAAINHASTKVIINTVYRQIFPNTNLFPLKKRAGECMAPWTGQVQISQDGNVGLCCAAPSYVLGNLHEKEFGEIWNDHKIRFIRNEFHAGFVPRICGFCRGIDASEYPIEFFQNNFAQPAAEGSKVNLAVNG